MPITVWIIRNNNKWWQVNDSLECREKWTSSRMRITNPWGGVGLGNEPLVTGKLEFQLNLPLLIPIHVHRCNIFDNNFYIMITDIKTIPWTIKREVQPLQYTRKDGILSTITGRMICDNMSNYMSGRPSQQTQRQSKHYMYVAAYWADNYWFLCKPALVQWSRYLKCINVCHSLNQVELVAPAVRFLLPKCSLWFLCFNTALPNTIDWLVRSKADYKIFWYPHWVVV